MKLALMLLFPCLLFSQQSREMRMSASPVPDSALIRSLGKPAKIWGALYVDTLHITHAGNIQISGFSNDAGYINSLQAGNKTYYGSQPVSPNSGDFWFDTTSAGQYLMKRWTWGQWKLVSVYMSDAGIYANNITAGQIVGGKITADLLVADSIKAGTFTGLIFRTKASGKRVEITSGIGATDNEMNFYETTGGSKVRIGSGIDGYTLPGINITDGAIYLHSVDVGTTGISSDISNVGGDSRAGNFYAHGTSGSTSYGIISQASGTGTNYSFYGFAGTLYNADTIQTNSGYKIGSLPLLGTGATQAAIGNHNHSGTYEPAISTLSIAKGGTNNTSYTDAQLLWYNYGTVSSSGYTAASFATSSHNHSGTYEPAFSTLPISKGGTNATSMTADYFLVYYALAGDIRASSYTWSSFATASHNQAWSTITSGVPTTLSGYGITDAHFDSSIPVTVYVASSSGGSPTTAISIYPINLGGTVLNALIKP
jgi:hypothetical protein